MLFQCSLLLQLAFNILFYPICTTFPPLHPPSRYQKSTWAFPNQPRVQNRRTSASDWHTETGPEPVKHLPEYTENTTPAKGLQVKFCPSGSGFQAQLLLPRPPQRCHPSAGPSWLLLWEMLPHTPAYLCHGLDHRLPGLTQEDCC